MYVYPVFISVRKVNFTFYEVNEREARTQKQENFMILKRLTEASGDIENINQIVLSR